MTTRIIDIVLLRRENDTVLLRSEPGVRLTLLDYDIAEDLLRSNAIQDDGTEWDGIGALDHDDEGLPYISSSPTAICATCGDWIGDDEPRTSVGTVHQARSYCTHCVPIAAE